MALNNKEYKKVQEFLKEKEADYSDMVITENGIEISVEWGDWKHSHLYLDYLMKELGYVYSHEQITEEDGSDCYSSIHFYKKVK
jgi:hypothetical protein